MLLNARDIEAGCREVVEPGPWRPSLIPWREWPDVRVLFDLGAKAVDWKDGIGVAFWLRSRQ